MATKAGNLPVAFVEEAHQSGYLPTPEETLGKEMGPEVRAMFHPRKESEWQFLHDLRRILEALGLIAFDGSTFGVSDEGAALLREPVRLHRVLLEGMFDAVEWRSGERFPTVPELQRGAGFLLYVGRKLSGGAGAAVWLPATRITDVFLSFASSFREAFFAESYHGDEGDATGRMLVGAVVRLRFFEMFADGLGLFEIRDAQAEDRTGSAFEIEFRTSRLFEILFE